MDQKEARKFIGHNTHFNPQMNPKPSTSPPSPSWWNKGAKNTHPLEIKRQTSVTSETASPVGSPTSGASSPPSFGTPDLGSKSHLPQPNMYKQFHFGQ